MLHVTRGRGKNFKHAFNMATYAELYFKALFKS